MSLPRFHKVVFVGAVILYLVAAWFSTGYHSADEHFQIVAFAQWKLGELPAAHLPWEFEAGIRSSLQPWIAALVFRGASYISCPDPFTRTLLLRSLTAILALLAMRDLIRTTIGRLGESSGKLHVLLGYGLWFLPFLAVRFSSEGWSAIFLVLLVTTILRSNEDKRWALKAGAFAGVAILCRPAMGLIVLSLLAWMHWVRRDRLRNIGQVISMLFAVLLIGVALDVAFYGRNVFTLWNYVSLGFGADPAVRFDTLPWWYYPPWIIKYAIPPIGAVILLAFAVLLIHEPKHVLVWIMLPFLIAHSVLPHKELRFLYPLAPLIPWLLIEAWSILQAPLARIPRWIMIPAAMMLAIANLFGLAVVVSTPAGEGRARLAKELIRVAAPGDRIGYVVESSTAWRITLPDFYQPKGTQEVILEPGRPITAQVEYLIAQEVLNPSLPLDPSRMPLMRSQPGWTDRLMRLYTWNEGPAPWTLYRVDADDR